MLTSETRIRSSARIPASKDTRHIAQPFSWKKELKELASYKFFNIAWWPLFRLRQRYFSHSAFMRSCKKLPGFKNLWSTIQKGSFAYNCLFLGMKPYQRHFSSTDLVDVTTLALFFGDEFIDGVCKAAGKDAMRQILNTAPGRFYLERKIAGEQAKLVYRFDLSKLLPADVMKQVTPKYGISYSEFYDLLEQFLQVMNEHLARLPFEKALLTADKIMDVCNTCLESYLHDIYSDPVDENIRDVQEVLHFHETKTRYMQEKFLELRCLLAGREEMMFSTQTQGWLDIMRVVQIYDDLQDVVEDDGYQDNLVISTAYHKFIEEWKWLKQNRQMLNQSGQRHFLISMFMPQTVDHCLQIASMRMRSMNWEQQKIMHYLLFRNWFVAEEGKLRDSSGREVSAQTFLMNMYHQLEFLMPGYDQQQIKAHLINACFHLLPLKKLLRKKINHTNYYQLRYDLLMVPGEVKSKVFDAIMQD